MLTARTFAVADALDAMTHDRPYRPARPAAAPVTPRAGTVPREEADPC